MSRSAPYSEVMSRNTLLSEIFSEVATFQKEIASWAAGSERAGQRARVASVKLGKMLKKFREVSLGKQ